MLAGKSAIVTGAGRGIGRATAIALARAGAAVVVNDLDAGPAEEVVAHIRADGGQAAVAIAPIGGAEAAAACVDAALGAFGRLDILCCNAGLLRDRVLWKTGDEDFDAVIRTHLRGTFACARSAALHWRAAGQGGRLILTGSVAGQRGNFGQTAYAAAKAGIAAMARTWSMELARDRVTVNAIVPTALTRMVATIPALTAHAEAAERGTPPPPKLRRAGLGLPEDVAPLTVFLASDAAAGITGQCIGIGGDRLSLWSHPEEIAVQEAPGGWSSEAIATAWTENFAPKMQEVGVKLTLD
ncbi:SDR family NAD(P)-dependent oxidoreductase [Halodurantibacterium flavum]|uniref:SDR family NAD(P)-dependent oxidoreductase n=1 Tax=Halodurantibacterium flavum TaxID=1382802 RepID=A0ABW4RZC7_9RHOB